MASAIAGWLSAVDCASPECADTATCAAVGLDGTAEAADAVNEAADDAPEEADGPPADDAPAADTSARDDGDARPPGDADAGTASDVVAVPDGCRAPEICTDGIDNNCDDKVDCADPTCTGFTCVPPIPNFWTGPAMLWAVPFSATMPPACPAGFTAYDLFGGPAGSSGSCSCTCSASGQQCSGSLALYSDQACQFSCGSASLSSTACAPITGCRGDQQGSMQAGAITPLGGTCVGTPSMTPGPPPSFSTRARLCTFVGKADSPGGCGTGQQCLVAPSAPFGTSVCVYRSGVQSSCPAPYDAGAPSVLYSGEMDTRGCSPCTCSAAPSGGTCSGTIAVSGGSNCEAPVATYTGPGCKPFAVSPFPLSAQGAFTVSSPGTCSVVTASQPTGAVSGTGPITVCCR